MSLLDRIGKEAQKVRAEREREALEKQRKEDRYEQVVAPAMIGLYDYLQALARDLGEVRPPVHLNFELTHYGPVPLSVLHDYKIEQQKRRYSFEISMSWRARVDYEKIKEVVVHGHRKVRQLIDQMRQLHLGGVREPEQGPNGDVVSARFHPRGFLHLDMHAKASAYDNYLRLSFRHLDSLGTTHKHVFAEQLDEAFYDRLGRFLVREDDELIKETLTPQMRARLQQAIGTTEPLEMYSETVLDPIGPIDVPFEVVDLNIDFDPDSVPRGHLPGDPPAAAQAPTVTAAPAPGSAGARAKPEQPPAERRPPAAAVGAPDESLEPATEADPTPVAPHPGATNEAELGRSFANLSERDRGVLLQSSLRALAPADKQPRDLEDDRHLKAAAFVLRMKLMEDKLRGKGS
jgi:hypothetical protein